VLPKFTTRETVFAKTASYDANILDTSENSQVLFCNFDTTSNYKPN